MIILFILKKRLDNVGNRWYSYSEGKKNLKKKGNVMDRLDIKTWADKKYQEQKETVKEYVRSGINTAGAVKIVLEGSVLGIGYQAQLRKDFGLSMFE